MNRRTFAALTALAAFAALTALAGCKKNEGPIDPAWGKQPCTHCAMAVTDKRFGAQILTKGGDRLFFDDLGCMIAYVDERGEPPASMWVHDAQTGAWVDAKTAHYAAARSPMDYGYESRADGTVSWDDVQKSVLAKAHEDKKGRR